MVLTIYLQCHRNDENIGIKKTKYVKTSYWTLKQYINKIDIKIFKVMLEMIL